MGKSIWRGAEDAHCWNSSLKTRKKILREKICPNKNFLSDTESVDLNLDHLLLSLKDFLTQLSISKGSMMQQVRPKTVVTTLQIRLAVQMQKHFDFGSTIFFSHGFCFSYSKVKQLKEMQSFFKVKICHSYKLQKMSLFIQYSTNIVKGIYQGNWCI